MTFHVFSKVSFSFSISFFFFFIPNIQHTLASSSSDLCSSIIHPLGYPCIDYKAITADGYILGVQRIPYGRKNPTTKLLRPPVFLQHGLLVNGESWFLDTPEQSLGFILADAGFDVWVGNIRGVANSRDHVSIPKGSKEYWDWSWDELAAYDLPAMIELVYDVTKTQIYFLGQSQGTLMALAAFSEGRVVNRLAAAALLAPVAYAAEVTSPIVKLIVDIKLDKIFGDLHINEVDFRRRPIPQFINGTCIYTKEGCSDLINSVGGVTCCFNISRVPYYLKYFPEPTSFRNGEHYFQMLKRGTFSKYDFGLMRNNEVYGTNVAPPYDVSNIPKDFHMFLAYGGSDTVADPNDVQRLIEMLPCNLEVAYLPSYSHFDFVLSTTANIDLFPKVISYFKNIHP